ncbi:MAG: endolytic transglycosylase MltG [Coriobacteriia bacterium]|nr:endolytic transglycosylase MltG [Coriobacteriia bacterium]
MAQDSPGRHFRSSKQSADGFGTPRNRPSTLRRDGEAKKKDRVKYRQTHHGKSSISGKHLFISVIIVVLILAGLVYFGLQKLNLAMIEDAAQETTQEQTGDLTVEIPEGAGTSSIANLLMDAGVIDNRDEFIAYVRTSGDDTALKPGAYSFMAGMTIEEIVDELKQGGEELGAKLTIPEGFRLEQIAARVEKVANISKDDFLAQAKASNYESDYEFLKGAYNDSLEGFLFPKTYKIPEGSDADFIIRKMLDQFVVETKSIDFNNQVAQDYKLDMHQLITIASLIERETSIDSERPKVAQVIYNRLDQKMPLQIDAAIVYALGGKTEHLSTEDLKVDSPYNVYANKGLPPGPIASPSLESIKAALAPEKSDLLYYVVNSQEGTHAFSKDYDQFLKDKEQYKDIIKK